MRTLAVDIETYSSASLPKTGVYVYAEAPDFTILLFGYAFDGAPVQVVDLAGGEALPREVEDALSDPGTVKTAFNANFERTCIAAYLRRPMPPEQWRCTAVLARSLGLPNSLADVGAALKLPEDKQKDKQGKALIRYFSTPCKPTQTNGGRTRNLPRHDPAKWELYKEYNRQDVEVERTVRRLLEAAHPLQAAEQRLWELDQRINDRGVRVDTNMAQRAIACDMEFQAHLTARAKAITGLANPKSTAQVKAWIEGCEGRKIENLRKEGIPALAAEARDPAVREYLGLRSDLSRTSIKKYEAIERCVCGDGRIRGMLLFYGAGRTGRWTGRHVQVHNLPQNHLKDLGLARRLLCAGEYELLERLWPSVPDTLSQLIRTALIPSPGCRFLVADFSAIEARVIAWLAGERWRLEVFRTHGKIYEASAAQMFHVPVERIHKGDPLRQKGKIAELALGYGGGVGALKNMGALNMGVKAEEMPGLVAMWRRSNPRITKFWWDVDAAACAAIKTPGKTVPLHHGISLRCTDGVLYIRLPSGRDLAYVRPRFDPDPERGKDKITYEGLDAKKWGRVDTYGPKLVENIVQAVARDCLAVAMRRLDELGYEIAFHVHDEVVLDVPVGKSAPEEVAAVMGQPIPWAPGLPLRADAYECEYYQKD